MLSTEQQQFVDEFFEKIVASIPTKDNARESLEKIRKAINNIDFEVDFLENQYFGE